LSRAHKPPDGQKYKEDETNLAMKLSRDQRRANRVAAAVDGTKSPDGRIHPRSFDQNPTYWTVFAALGIVLLLILICSLSK
jgi:hypothetical protein